MAPEHGESDDARNTVDKYRRDEAPHKYTNPEKED